jgi:hypothetical protein
LKTKTGSYEKVNNHPKLLKTSWFIDHGGGKNDVGCGEN